MESGGLTAFRPDIWQCERTVIGGPDWPRWDWKALSYPYWRIYWNEEPGAVISLDGVDYPLDPESVVVVAPNSPIDHQLTGAVRHYYMHATLGYPYDSVEPRILLVPARNLPMHFLRAAAAEGKGRGRPKRVGFAQTLGAYAFVCGVLSQLPSDIWPKPAADPAIRDLVQDISRQPELAYRTSDVAERCGMSVNTLLRRFREQVGRSPQQFVTQSRLQKACVLLDHTGQSIEQIADACGFSDRYHLSKVFKKAFGCGPATFRQKHFPRSVAD